MPHAITQSKDVRESTIPSYVRKLEGVNENKDAKEYSREATIKKFSEEERMSYHIKSFRHISLASENIRTISKKEIHSFDNKPCKHGLGYQHGLGIGFTGGVEEI